MLDTAVDLAGERVIDREAAAVVTGKRFVVHPHSLVVLQSGV